MKAARFDVEAPVPMMDELGRVHVLAVGGAGMSAVARLLLAAGVTVSGSDAKDSAVCRLLAAEGVQVWIGHDPAHVQDADTVVFSSAVREDNPELAAARAAGLRVLHRSQALAVVTRARRTVAVAGANGKTTTSSMLAEALVQAGRHPSYAIGGELVSTGTNAALDTGPEFVAEADESDGSFLVYHPQVAIVTNVQPDHLDFYGTFDAVQDAYAAFAGTIAQEGLLVACADDEGSRGLADRARAAGIRVVTYGESDDAEVRLREIRLDGLTGSAQLRLPGEEIDRVLTISVPGLHNLLNATAAVAAAVLGLGLPADPVLQGLSSFQGARRRFEARGEAAGVRVVDDYAHNPGKVAAVVGTAARIARPGRLVVAFQPHLYSRTRDFAADFGVALAQADVVLVLDVYAAREDPIPGVTGELVAAEIRACGGAEVDFVPEREAVAERLRQHVRPGDLLLTVGAGDVTEVGPQVLELLARHGCE